MTTARRQLARDPGPHESRPPARPLGTPCPGLPLRTLPGPGAPAALAPKQPDSHERRWQMETTNHEPKQKSAPKIKIHSHGKRNDNRTTEAEIKTVSALHVACGLCGCFVCVRASVPAAREALWGSFRSEANGSLRRSVLAKTKGGRRKPQANLDFLLVNISRGWRGPPTQSTKATTW